MNDTNIVDDSNLVQCEYCGYVTDSDDVPTANDPCCSDGTVTVCPECDEGESFLRYDPAKAIIRDQGIAHQAAEFNRA
jgi:NAD-dependent SIR2 family protein deacetylase